MQLIQAILLDPVGSLAEFPAQPFEAIAVHLTGRGLPAGISGSQAYWDVLDLLDPRGPLPAQDRAFVESWEMRAVERASLYEDAAPALAELDALGMTLIVASSLSAAAVDGFLTRFSLRDVFANCSSRDSAGGVKRAPLVHALADRGLAPDRTMVLADTAAGLQAAKEAGAHAILMMNDPDEAMRLAAHDPAGGIVSLHELPDFLRVVRAAKGRLSDRLA